MKLSADIEGYQDAIRMGAIKGAGFGSLMSLGISQYLRRRTSFFTGAGGFQKTFVYVVPAAFCTIVNMEFVSRKFEEKKLAEQHGVEPAEEPVLKTEDSLHSRFTNWMAVNKYKVIVTGWAASLAGSFYLVNRDKYMTKSQKIVQARVYAQGLTVAMLVASVFLSVTTDKTSPEEKQKAAKYQSQSWQRDIKFVETANHPHGINSTKEQQEESEKARALLNESNKKIDPAEKTATSPDSSSTHASTSDNKKNPEDESNMTAEKSSNSVVKMDKDSDKK